MHSNESRTICLQKMYQPCPSILTLPPELKLQILYHLTGSPSSFFTLVRTCKDFHAIYIANEVYLLRSLFETYAGEYADLVVKLYNVETYCKEYSETEESFVQKATTPLPKHPPVQQLRVLIDLHRQMLRVAQAFLPVELRHGFIDSSVQNIMSTIYYRHLVLAKRYIPPNREVFRHYKILSRRASLVLQDTKMDEFRSEAVSFTPLWYEFSLSLEEYLWGHYCSLPIQDGERGPDYKTAFAIIARGTLSEWLELMEMLFGIKIRTGP